MSRIHLDTDLGGRALLRLRQEVEITGITTVAEANGRRAGYARAALEMAGQKDVPVTAGADVAQGFYRYAELGYPDDDIVNFLHDPLACAIALGWDEGVEIAEAPLVIEEKEGWLAERIAPAGKPMRVVTKADGPAFSEFWVDAMTNRPGGWLASSIRITIKGTLSGCAKLTQR